MDFEPRYGDPDNTLLAKIAGILNAGGGGSGSGVSTFNGRTGAVSLTSGDINGALGFTPGNPALYVLKAGDTMTGDLLFNISGPGPTDSWRTVAYNFSNGNIIALGTSEAIYSSDGGVNWTRVPTADSLNWNAIADDFNNTGQVVAVASSGVGSRAMYSSDGGASWNLAATPADNNWTSLAYSSDSGRLVAVASSGVGNRVMTSDDGGVTWDIRVSAADNNWTSVCWSPDLGLFAAVASSGAGNRVMTSPDGETWTIRTSAANNNWSSVIWDSNNGIFLAVASSGVGNRVMTSPDGINWTIRLSAADNDWTGVCFDIGNGVFVAVASSGTGDRAMYSGDGINWTLGATSADRPWSGIAFDQSNTVVIAVAEDPTSSTSKAMRSLDGGQTWTNQDTVEITTASIPNDVITAQATADNAQSTANAAQTTANAAQTTANAAQTTANAALPKSGGTMSGAIAMGSNKITGLGAASAGADAVRFDQVSGVYLPLAGGTMTGAITLASGGLVFGGGQSFKQYAADITQLIRGSNSQRFYVFNDFDSGTGNGEFLEFGWSGNVGRIGPNETNAGTPRNLLFHAQGTECIRIGTTAGFQAKVSFFAQTLATQQTSGANLTNNVTAGGTDNTIADFTSLTVYASDAAAIRNNIYQLARKLKQINDGLRTYGLFT